jgi:hypothetical protein
MEMIAKPFSLDAFSHKVNEMLNRDKGIDERSPR